MVLGEVAKTAGVLDVPDGLDQRLADGAVPGVEIGGDLLGPDRPALAGVDVELLCRHVGERLGAGRQHRAAVDLDRCPCRQLDLTARLDHAGANHQHAAVLGAGAERLEMAAFEHAVTRDPPLMILESMAERSVSGPDQFSGVRVRDNAARCGSCIETMRRSSHRVTRPSASRTRRTREGTPALRWSSWR